MNRNIRNLLIVGFVFIAKFGFTADNTDGNPSSSIQSSKAQQTLTLADQARDKTNYAEAIKFYREALIAYTKLSASYPDWQPGITQFRIAYCNNQLEALLSRIDEKELSTIASEKKTNMTEAGKPAVSTNTAPEPAAPSIESSKPDSNKIEMIRIEAKLLLERGDTEKARSVLLSGLQTEPDDKTMRILMAMTHCRANEFDNAMYLSESLLQEDPSNATVRVILGTAYYGQGKIQAAAKQLQEALAINPKFAEAHYNLAQILLSASPPDTNSARNHYKSALELGAKADTNLNHLLQEPAN